MLREVRGKRSFTLGSQKCLTQVSNGGNYLNLERSQEKGVPPLLSTILDSVIL